MILKRITATMVLIFVVSLVANSQTQNTAHIRYRDKSVTVPERISRAPHQSGVVSTPPSRPAGQQSTRDLSQQLAKLESETRRTDISVKTPATAPAKPARTAEEKPRGKSMNFSHRTAAKTAQQGSRHRAASL